MKPKRLIVVRFRKDRGKWEVDRWNPPGSETARSRTVFDTEEEALTYAAEIAPTLGAAAPPARDQHMTLEQAFTRYLEATARKRSHTQDERMAEYLKAHFGPNTRLRDITANRIAQYKEQRLAAGSVRRKDEHGRPAPLSAASINRPLALLRSLLRTAHRTWEVLPKMPVITLEKEPEGRVRWLEPDEEARLLAACAKSQNPHLLAIVTVALETGLRKGELLGLTWTGSDLSRGIIRLEVTKSGKRREVPMRQTVYDILSKMPEPRTGRVWPDVDIRSAFETAVEQAKLDAPLTFHDLRHSFASHWMMRGGKLESLSKILGHATLAMTMRYAHLSPEHLRSEMERTERATPRVNSNRNLRATEPLLEPNAGTRHATPDEAASQVVDSPDECRGSSVAEQLIRNQ